MRAFSPVYLDDDGFIHGDHYPDEYWVVTYTRHGKTGTLYTEEDPATWLQGKGRVAFMGCSRNGDGMDDDPNLIVASTSQIVGTNAGRRSRSTQRIQKVDLDKPAPKCSCNVCKYKAHWGHAPKTFEQEMAEEESARRWANQE